MKKILLMTGVLSLLFVGVAGEAEAHPPSTVVVTKPATVTYYWEWVSPHWSSGVRIRGHWVLVELRGTHRHRHVSSRRHIHSRPRHTVHRGHNHRHTHRRHKRVHRR